MLDNGISTFHIPHPMHLFLKFTFFSSLISLDLYSLTQFLIIIIIIFLNLYFFY